jgi:hypothetical protein
MTPLPPPEFIDVAYPDESVRRILCEHVDWNGVRIRVEYEAEWLGDYLAHLSLHVVDPPRAPIPVTETGYRSHFVAADAVEQTGGPSAYVTAWLDEASRSIEWRGQEEERRQLSLF